MHRCLVFAAVLASAHALVAVAPAFRSSQCIGHPQRLPLAAAPCIGVATAPAAALRSGPVRMQDLPFWENVGRFMRFGITSITGLIAGLLAPFSAFLRTPTLAAIGATLLVGILVFINLTLTSMKGDVGGITNTGFQQVTPPSYSQPKPAGGIEIREREDPTMKKMLNEIYGEYN